MKLHRIYWILGFCLLLSCQPATDIHLKEGLWRMELLLHPGVVLPFTFELNPTEENYTLTIINSDERIKVEDIRTSGDSIFIRMPIFDTEFRGKIVDTGLIEGYWYNYSRSKDYRIAFRARAGESTRFPLISENMPTQIDSVWQVNFQPEPPDQAYAAVGKFTAEKNHLYGTFLTETGDYRYLEGVVDGDSVKLSAFDGEHAFLFLAALQPDGSLHGKFYSGNHWQESWQATPNPEATLRDADSLTFLKPGYDRFTFTFPDLEGNPVSLDDPRYQGKVVIVQLMGSWCPNCMDETKLMARWYDQYKDKGLEVIGLAFERAKDPERAAASIRRLTDYFAVSYEILLAHTSTNKLEASEKLPMLNQVMAFPTTLFLDRKGNIRRIHTGFSGPGTGKPYEEFVAEYSAFVEEMLGEE
ncbi:MAG: TlpA disulfide reductase family protein [Bacteroidia bacterium]|nr:TlpA disulfide reductase family protein [Bacteroidia bacterium]